MRTWTWVEVFPGVWTAVVQEGVPMDAVDAMDAMDAEPWVVDAVDLPY